MWVFIYVKRLWGNGIYNFVHFIGGFIIQGYILSGPDSIHICANCNHSTIHLSQLGYHLSQPGFHLPQLSINFMFQSLFFLANPASTCSCRASICPNRASICPSRATICPSRASICPSGSMAICVHASARSKTKKFLINYFKNQLSLNLLRGI